MRFGRDKATSPLVGQQIARRSITADARPIDLEDRKESDRFKKRGQKWQSTAWNNYDSIGEVWFAHNYVGNSLARVRQFPAFRTSAQTDPVPLTEKDDGQLFIDATEAINILMLPPGGQTPMLSDFGVSVGVSGEGYIVGEGIGSLGNEGRRDRTGALVDEKWCAYSSDQLRTESGDWFLTDVPGEKGRKIDKGTSYVARLWQPHRRFREMADSAMRPLESECEELILLSQMIRAQAQSRLNAGLLLVPNELSFSKADPTRDNAGDGDGDDFVEDLLTALITPIEQPDSASAVAPNVIRGGIEALNALRWIELSRTLDPQAQNLRNELLGRIANGLDLPREVVLGVSSSPFSRTSWQIDAQTWKSHLEPKVLILDGGFTTAFLRPWLAALGHAPELLRNLVVWHDPDDLLGDPNSRDNALAAYDRLELAGAKFVESLGFDPDTDRPDDAEIAARIDRALAIRQATRTTSSDVPAEGGQQARTDEIMALARVGAHYLEERGAREHQERVTAHLAGEERRREASRRPFALTASSDPHARLGAKLARADRDLMLRLQGEARGAAFRALERAGARVRRKLGQQASMVRGVDNALVCAYLTDHGASLGFEDGDLLDGAFDGVAETYNRLVPQTLQRARDAAGIEVVDLTATKAQDDDDQAAGWLLLAAALTALTIKRLHGGAIDSPLGEHDADVGVPAGLVRVALQRAGGATGPKVGSSLTVAGKQGPEPAGMLATSGKILGPLHDQGIVTSLWLWVHGEPDREFPAHADLDGVDFEGWYAPELAVMAGDEWLGTDFYFPGDHDGCTCAAEPVLVATMVEDSPDE